MPTYQKNSESKDNVFPTRGHIYGRRRDTGYKLYNIRVLMDPSPFYNISILNHNIIFVCSKYIIKDRCLISIRQKHRFEGVTIETRMFGWRRGEEYSDFRIWI